MVRASVRAIIHSLTLVDYLPVQTHKYTLTIACSMTFYFSFEVLLKLKPIQTNIKGGGASNRE